MASRCNKESLRYSEAMLRSAATLALASLLGCVAPYPESDQSSMDFSVKVKDYVSVRLEADTSALTAGQKAMIPVLVEAAAIMDGLFWQQAFGGKEQFLRGIADPNARRFAEINYGPWDRLGANRPFLAGFGPKPPGANYYPPDMTKEEFDEAAKAEPELRSQYALIRRDSAGALIAVPYHKVFQEELSKAAALLRQAAGMAEHGGFRHYLKSRATALETNDYQGSDFAWMDMRGNAIDIVIGPIESYEDRLFGTKTAFEAYVLIKDREWSSRLEKYSSMLPELQDGLPVPERYKSEEPGGDSELNAYDVIYYAGDCNAGAKTIAINLPNDEQVQLEVGSRRLQLKNAMKAKFDSILLPIAEVVVAKEQRPQIDFDAFFANTMFHEVAHGLGIKNTVEGNRTVREALREAGSALEEAKADILGLHLIGRLEDSGDLPEGSLGRSYVTYLAGIFRSIRFGSSSAHGSANTLSFNFLQRKGAFSADGDTGRYRVNVHSMRSAVDALSGEILRIQGDGDYERATQFLHDLGQVEPPLQGSLDLIEAADIPVDIVFEQGRGTASGQE